MMNMKFFAKSTVGLLAVIAPVVAFSHVGGDGGVHHTLGFMEGFTHPFFGLDHLCAMIMVGIWSAMNTHKWWVAPATFASLLLVGALVGMSGVTVPAVEHIVAASLLVIGLMVFMRLKLPVAVGAVTVGAFAIFHGLAHGAELSHSASALAGMVSATAILHVIGLGIGYFLLHKKYNVAAARVIGLGSSVLGIGLLAGVF